MSYKILLPVTNNPELVQDKIREVPLDRLILVNNFDNPEVEILCKQAEDGGAEVHRYPRNLGLAASWNLGMRKIKEDGNDFLIILSASAVLEDSIERFADSIVDYESQNGLQYRYLASGRATLHCFAQTNVSVDVGGYFDENFWPIYYEDTDYCRRSKLNGINTKVVPLNLPDLVYSRAYSIAMRDKRLFKLHQFNAGRIGQYYVDKWGAHQGSETYITPFNDPSIGVNDWALRPGVTEWYPGIYEGRF